MCPLEKNWGTGLKTNTDRKKLLETFIKTIYKEALNQATTEIINSRRNYERKLTVKIKYDSKTVYAYARNKHNVTDKVDSLEGST